MRDRLIELLERIETDYWDECAAVAEDGYKCAPHLPEFFTDRLLPEGVIVPPCKFGDTIFVIPSEVNCKLNILHKMPQNNRVYEQIIHHIIIWRSDYMLYTCDGLCAVRSKAYKDTWFLTREEAEKALAERSENE